jgi:beta-lactamase class A
MRIIILARTGFFLFLGLAISTLAHGEYPELRESRDAALQAQLEAVVARLDLDGAVDRNALTVVLVDITDRSRPRLASINGDEMMYAASLPKIAILLGAFERIEAGELEYDDNIRNKLVSMIRNSSNSAATEMLHQVGMPYLAELLQSPRYGLYDHSYNGGLWVGKEYGKGAAWKRDPLHNLSHGATALQVARYYYLLETGQLVSRQASREMKEILGQPAIHHKFVKGLKTSSPNAKIFRKSGSWRNWHADSAIVEHGGRRYIAVALAEDSRGGAWLSDLIVGLDDVILQQPTQVAQLRDNVL